MASQQLPKLTEEQYLAIERAAETKSEFLNGQMFAMAGGTDNHSLLAVNFAIELGSRLRGSPCRVFNSDLRVKIPATGLLTYPDLSIVCGPRRFADDVRDTVLNPVVLVEVLSPSSEAYDRGEKFRHYRQIETLRDYILVSQKTVLVEHYVRQEGGVWALREYSRLEEELRIESIGAAAPLSGIYDGVEFGAD